MMGQEVLLEVHNLQTHFTLEQSVLEKTVARIAGRSPRKLRAVDGVSFTLAPGETLGLVGESGCGKTTLGRSVLRLIPPTAGEVYFRGSLINELTPGNLRTLRPRMQIVFQDPGRALNPRRTIGASVGRALEVIGVRGARERNAMRADLLRSVALRPELANRYPHQLSGGQKQRACIARAIATEPDLVVADEPVSSLDVSVQAQILNLFTDLQRERGLAILFISHDLGVVRQVSHRIAVMYAGRILEIGPAERVVDSPLHPYTQRLLAAVPRLHRHWDREVEPSRGTRIGEQSDGECPYLARCSTREHEMCPERAPELVEVAPGHSVACYDIVS